MLDESKKKNPQWNPAHDVLRSFMKDWREAGAVTPNDIANNVWATSMDGPSISWTVNDLFKFDNRTFLLYHCMSSGFDVLTPIGGILGAFALPRTSKFSNLTRLQAAGTGSAIAGGLGLSLGALALVGVAYSKDPPLPFDDDGIQTRVDGLSHNYGVRARDLGVWIASAAAGGAMLAAGGPVRLGLSPGTMGIIQVLALGSMTGSIASSVVVALTK